jgi:ornithine cyclodeaminase/alanine dehydrogenase-like protein (mu-crystallin family)
MDALIPAMESALRALSSGTVVQPARTAVPVASRGGFLWSMPAYTGGHLGAKLVTYFPGNTGVETHHAIIVMFSAETGEPIATLDARLITEMRTGAVSAAATKALARPDASVLAILGAGAQARSHLEALRLVRNFREVRVWSPRNAAPFARVHGVALARSAEHAVRDADVIVVATSSRAPVLLGDWVSPGTHINAVGAARPDWREVDNALLAKAKLFVESRTAATAESGDVRAAGAIHAEIGEVFGGTRRGRDTIDEITLFKSVGVAVADIASAALVMSEYARAGAA